MSTQQRYVIIGGVAGGMSTATRLRRNDELAQITVLERGPYVSFANCGLPYHVGGVIAERDDLLLQTPESLAERFNIDVRVRTEAISINRTSRSVIAHDLDSGTTVELPYDALVLAPGAAPFLPHIPGIDRAMTVRTIPDVDAMIESLASSPSTAVMLGGGFIGLEMAENLVARGLHVAIVELADQLLAPLDPEMAQPIAEHLRAHGVELHLGVSATHISETDVELSSGLRLEADLVVAAIGVRPESSLARDAGLAIGARGGIVVDSSQRTSDPHIYAVGDAAEKVDAIDAQPTLVPLAQTANRHGRLVADVITGRVTTSKPVLGTAVVGVMGMTAATTGWNEKRLRAAGRPYRAIHTHPNDHASYYPGAEGMALKLLVDPATDQILGAQGIGRSGVDKRIDVIATAVRSGLTASDLADLELAYAPQYGSAKDPVNMLGFVNDNLASGVTRSVQWHELEAEIEAGATLLDVRDIEELTSDGAIPNAVNIPVDELRSRAAELPDARIIVTCAVGVRANVAARLLSHFGYETFILDGGFATWSAGTASRRSEETLARA
jgi:NADPH-dependent 2,4-dienoyl-CoA reductase/sulfur reductase-like enzyme/rhodanese-related sulfurtransferase